MMSVPLQSWLGILPATETAYILMYSSYVLALSERNPALFLTNFT
jgi:hypothetical protein